MPSVESFYELGISWEWETLRLRMLESSLKNSQKVISSMELSTLKRFHGRLWNDAHYNFFVSCLYSCEGSYLIAQRSGWAHDVGCECELCFPCIIWTLICLMSSRNRHEAFRVICVSFNMPDYVLNSFRAFTHDYLFSKRYLIRNCTKSQAIDRYCDRFRTKSIRLLFFLLIGLWSWTIFRFAKQ